MKKISFPWLERSYGEGLKNQYDQEHSKKFIAWLSSQAEHAERGYVKYNDIDDLIYDEFTEDDKERVRERLIANIEIQERNLKEWNESRG